MQDKKKFRDEMHAFSSAANSLDWIVEFLYERFEKKKAADESPYYTVKEAAERRKVSSKTIMRHEAKGLYSRVFKKGKVVFFKKDIDKTEE